MNKKLFFVGFFLAFFLWSGAQMVHPGMLHNRAELDFVKNMVRKGKEPWLTAFKKMQADEHAGLAWKAHPRDSVIRGSYNNPNIGAGDLGNDSQAAYAHAIEWYITRKKEHAEKVAEILQAWASTLKSIAGSDRQLLTGITGYKFLNAAEILKYSWNGWKESDQRQFREMMTGIFYPLIKNYRPQANGNWDASMIVTTMCLGIFLDDMTMYKGAVDYALNGKSNGSIPNYIAETGQCQESGRDQGHTQLGLAYVADYCEVAWKQGDDLYSAFDNRVAAGFEYTTKYNLGMEVPYKAVPDFFGNNLHPEISEKGRGSFRPVYEKVYRHYHDFMGLKMEYTGRVLSKTRPEGYHWDHSSWGSLMYRKVPVQAKGSFKK